MIHIEGNVITIQTQNTSYILYIDEQGQVNNAYYGARIQVDTVAPLITKVQGGYGSDVLQQEGVPALSSLPLELSSTNRGDYRLPALLARTANGSTTTQFTFRTARLLTGALAPAGGMPQGQEPDDVLELSFSESSGLTVELFYSVFYSANVITKKMRIVNQSAQPVQLLRAFSQQLDLPATDYTLYTLTGAWAREFDVQGRALAPGQLRFGSTTGASSHRCNPFFFLAQNDATEDAGEVYGFNLVYSGSHEACVEVDTHGHTRISNGIQSEGFCWPLQAGDSFVTPEAVLTFSEKGKNGMSANMHCFVKQHIVPKRWANAPRPVLVNNWEGTYFDFNEAKIMGMARIAAKLGIELFVLDDGWFGERNSDTAGLGDYNVNKKKLPNGLAGLSDKINRLGLQFGLWVEPEMVSEESQLYKNHPDWAVHTPGYTPCVGRHQLVLDLCREEVQQYIVQQVNNTLSSANISYIKWDMNRHISDNYSPGLQNQGQFSHQYILGLYNVLGQICGQHPDVLFEGCASGGNRFDLGILCYMPQIWTSDDTDAHQRQRIQSGISYGYPQCTMGCHVSAVPNHQTLRITPLETRFETAMFGLLGYELDLRHITDTHKKDIALQVSYYKKHRMLLQYGDFYRRQIPAHIGDGCRWVVVDQDKKQAIAADLLGLVHPNATHPPLKFTGLLPQQLYRVTTRAQKINISTFGGLVNHILPVHLNPNGIIINTADKLYRLPTEDEQYTAYGSLLCKAGIHRRQGFSGSGYSQEMRLLGDFSSRIYYAEAVEGGTE